MQKPKFVQKNETSNPLRARGPNVGLISKWEKKDNLSSCGFCSSREPQNKNNRKACDRQILGPYEKTKSLGLMVISVVVGELRKVPKGLERWMVEIYIREIQHF